MGINICGIDFKFSLHLISEFIKGEKIKGKFFKIIKIDFWYSKSLFFQKVNVFKIIFINQIKCYTFLFFRIGMYETKFKMLLR